MMLTVKICFIVTALIQGCFSQMNVCEYQSLLNNIPVGNLCQADRISSMRALNLGVDLIGITKGTGYCLCTGEITYIPDRVFNMSIELQTFYNVTAREVHSCGDSMKIFFETQSLTFTCGTPRTLLFQSTGRKFQVKYEKNSDVDTSYLWCMTFIPRDPGVDKAYRPIISFKCDQFVNYDDIYSTTSSPTTSNIRTTNATVTPEVTTHNMQANAVCDDEIKMNIIIPIVTLAVVFILTVLAHVFLYKRRSKREEKQQELNAISNTPVTPGTENDVYGNEIGTYTSIRRDDLGLGTYDSIRYDIVHDNRRLNGFKNKHSELNGRPVSSPYVNGGAHIPTDNQKDSTRVKHVYSTECDRGGYLSPSTSVNSTSIKRLDGEKAENTLENKECDSVEPSSNYIHPD